MKQLKETVGTDGKLRAFNQVKTLITAREELKRNKPAKLAKI